MNRLLSAALCATAAFTATAALADNGSYYVATPVAAPSKTALMTRATPWTAKGDSYVARRAAERNQVLCQLVARDVGELSSFSAAGKPLDADDLAKCNAKAKPVGTTAVAR